MSNTFFEKYHVIADHKRSVGMGVRSWEVAEVYSRNQAEEWGVQKGWRVVQVGNTKVDASMSTDTVENLFRNIRKRRQNYEIVFERPVPVMEMPPAFNPEYKGPDVSAVGYGVSEPVLPQPSYVSPRYAMPRSQEQKIDKPSTEKGLVETAYETSKPIIASAYKTGKPIVIAGAKAGWGFAKLTSKTIYNKWMVEPTPKGTATKASTEKKETLDKNSTATSDNVECKVCLDKRVNTCFQPCGHASCCENCAKVMTNCPMCRQRIEKILKIYL